MKKIGNIVAIFCLVRISLAYLVSAAAIEPAPDAPRPLSPADSARTFRFPSGFRVDLIASEPLITEPSGVCWDEHGRLFISELHGYNVDGWHDIQELNKTGVLDTQVRRIRVSPEVKQRAAAETYGTVKLLLDKDGDGRMDESVVWAKDLPPCYGIVPARGGIIAVCAPDIVFLADTNGDNQMDVRRTLFTGFSTGELERGINCPQWGVDNWIYIGAGWGDSTVTGPLLSRPVELGHTDFRIRPDGSAIEPVEGETGTFGHGMTESGERFFTETSRHARYALPLPWRYLTRNPDASMPGLIADAAQDSHTYPISPVHPWRSRRAAEPAWVKFYGVEETAPQGFFTSACGAFIYQDVAWPAEYRGHHFVCDPAQNLISRSRLQNDGPGFKVQRVPTELRSEFFAASDSWFRPIYLTHAPDGSIWIVDMYREIIEDYSAIPRFLQQQYDVTHGKDRGRLWRLTHKGASPAPRASMADLRPDQLVNELGSPHFWRRQTARRLLIEKKSLSMVPAISALLNTNRPAAATALDVLYALEGLNALRESDLLAAFQHPSPDVKRHALRIADQRFDTVGKPLEDQLLGQQQPDPHETDPRFLLQSALSLGQSRRPEVPAALAQLARTHGNVRWIDAAIASSAHGRENEILARLVPDPGLGNSVIESLTASVAAKGNAQEIGATRALLHRLPDADQTNILHRILDAGLASALPRKPDAPTIALLEPPSADSLARIEEQTPAFVAVLNGKRNSDQGRELFREHCAACHIAKGIGVAVGPNLDAERQRAELTILRDILFPTETIRPGFETFVVETRRGESFQGILASESPTSLTLRVPAGEELTVLRKWVTRSRTYKISLMPHTYSELLNPADVADITAFLRSP